MARALYFSRLPVPWGAGERWHHIGIYAFAAQALARFVALPHGVLERREQLEQLRALEAGMRIAVRPGGARPLRCRYARPISTAPARLSLPMRHERISR